MSASTLLPFQPMAMSQAQLAAVSYLARYSGRTHDLFALQLRRWFTWCEANDLDPLIGIQRAHVELYIRQRGESGLQDSSVVTMRHGVRGFFRFAHIDGSIGSDPAVYARLPKANRDETRTQGLDRLELIRFLQVAPNAHRPPRGLGVPPRHQSAARFRGRGGADRGLRKDPSRTPGAASGRQGQRARHDAGHGAGAAGVGGVSWRAHRRPVSAATDVREAHRPPRRVPDGCPDREGGRHSAPHQPPLAAARRDHQRPRRGRPLRDAQIPARHADPRTTEHYDRARGNLDRHGVHFLTAYVAGV